MDNRKQEAEMERDMAIAEIEEALLTIEAYVNAIRDALAIIKVPGGKEVA